MKWTNKGHELDHIGNVFQGRKKVYIYGSMALGQEMYQKLEFLNCVEGFIDGNPQKQEETVLGKPVISIEELDPNQKDFIIIISASAEAKMTERCLFLGFTLGVDIFYQKVFIEFFLPIYAKYAHDKVVIRLSPQSLSEVCTLCCLHCNHSLPFLADPVHFTFEEFKRDVDLFFKYVDFVYYMDLVGGEPFTNPDFYEIARYTLETYGDRMYGMRFVSNGTILPDEKMLKLMQKYDVMVSYTDYTASVPRIKERTEAFKALLTEHDIFFTADAMTEWKDYGIARAENKFTNEQEKIDWFDNCQTPCRYMRDGKLYFCTSDRMAQRAGITPEDPSSYLDFTTLTTEDRMSVLEFEYGFSDRGYPLLCTKCNRQFSINSKTVSKATQYKDKKPLAMKDMIEMTKALQCTE